MPARVEEVENAEEEGKGPLADEPCTVPRQRERVVTGVDACASNSASRCLGSATADTDQGVGFVVDVDIVVVTIGQSANPIVASTATGVETNERGYFIARRGRPHHQAGVCAGGDIVTGAATVILAIGAGKKAARAMHEYLSGDGSWPEITPIPFRDYRALCRSTFPVPSVRIFLYLKITNDQVL